MLHVTTVSTQNELEQIQKLNEDNLKGSLSEKERSEEGFVTWLYSLDLLQKMHDLAPSIIVKDDEDVVAYALVTLKEAGSFHTDLQAMIGNLRQVYYLNQPLLSLNFYLMGQVCIHKNYRGKGVFAMLYQHHKTIYSKNYDLLVTEISAYNKRSLKAHEKMGFQTIYTYSDKIDEWNVVVWDWSFTQPI